MDNTIGVLDRNKEFCNKIGVSVLATDSPIYTQPKQPTSIYGSNRAYHSKVRKDTVFPELASLLGFIRFNKNYVKHRWKRLLVTDYRYSIDFEKWLTPDKRVFF